MIFLILILILQCGVMALLKLLGIVYDIEGLSMLFIAGNCVVFTLIGLKEVKNKKFYICYCAAFFIRLLLLFTDYYVVRIMHSGSDTEKFFNVAAEGFDSSLSHYYLVLSAFFEIVGAARLFAQFMNLCCGMISCLLVLRALDKLRLNEKAKLLGFSLICFLPNWVDMSVILLRESIIGVCVAFALYYFVLWLNNGSLNNLISAVIATLPAVFLHSGVIAVAAVIIATPIVYSHKTEKFKIGIRSFIILCSLGCFAICFLNAYGAKILPYLGTFELSRILRIQDHGVSQIGIVGSIYLENLNASTWMDFILFTPIRWLYFYLSPMPWDWRGLEDVAAFVLSGLPTFFVFTYTVVAVATSKDNRHLLLILSLAVIAFGVIYAWGTIAAGTAMRHRDKIVPIYAIMLAVSYDARLKRHLDHRLPKRIVESIKLA